MMANPESEESFKKQDIEREESSKVDVARPKDRRLLTKKVRSKGTSKKKSENKSSTHESKMTPESQNFEAKTQHPASEEITVSPDPVEDTLTPESQNLEEKVKFKPSKRARKKNLP